MQCLGIHLLAITELITTPERVSVSLEPCREIASDFHTSLLKFKENIKGTMDTSEAMPDLIIIVISL